jgi:hypothetical protein
MLHLAVSCLHQVPLWFTPTPSPTHEKHRSRQCEQTKITKLFHMHQKKCVSEITRTTRQQNIKEKCRWSVFTVNWLWAVRWASNRSSSSWTVSSTSLRSKRARLFATKTPFYPHNTKPPPSKKNTNQGVKISLKHKDIPHLDALIAATQETSTRDSAEDFP